MTLSRWHSKQNDILIYQYTEEPDFNYKTVNTNPMAEPFYLVQQKMNAIQICSIWDHDILQIWRISLPTQQTSKCYHYHDMILTNNSSQCYDSVKINKDGR